MSKRVLIALVMLWGATAARADEVDDRLAHATQLTAQRAQLDGERHALDARYQEKTRAIDELKASPASWSRDRKLQALLADSKDMAATLDQDDERLRALAAAITADDRALLPAIDAALAARPAAERVAVLQARRAEIVQRQAAARRLKAPDENIAPTDDATDLEYKAAALAESETELAAEGEHLAERAARYHQLAALTKSRARADEADVFRDEEPRLGATHHNGGTLSDTPSQGGTPTVGGGPGSVTPGGANSAPPAIEISVDPSLVLVDVVGPSTLDQLRRAEQSRDPEARARAAERAEQDLAARAQRVHQRRLEMERRAHQLRLGP